MCSVVGSLFVVIFFGVFLGIFGDFCEIGVRGGVVEFECGMVI